MKKCWAAGAIGIIYFCLAPVQATAFGVEFAAGLSSQTPAGKASYQSQSTGDTLDFEEDMNLDREFRLSGRIKIDMPLMIPNVYLMATPMSFDGTGSKNVNFNFGDSAFNADVPFSSDIQLTHYDAALFYSIPLLKTATLNTLNIDLGINVRFIDLSAKLTQNGRSDSESVFLPLPMLFAAVQFTPIKRLGLEAEFRGISFSGNNYYSIIGRINCKIAGPLFASAGYRFDSINVNESGLDIAADISGPFLELGLQF